MCCYLRYETVMLAIMRPMDRTPFPPARSPRSPALALALGGGAARCLRWPSARQRRSRACKWQRKAPRRRSRPRTPGWRSTALTWPGFRRRSRPRGRRRSSGGRARLAPASGGEAGPAGSGADLAAAIAVLPRRKKSWCCNSNFVILQ